jgi:putative YphP/YqiW family bacilliredoxin
VLALVAGHHGTVSRGVLRSTESPHTYQMRRPVPYPEHLIVPMRQELTRLGIEELRTAEQVDHAVRETPGTLMIVVNSVCGCAAGRARPGLARALAHPARPDRVATVFAGADVEATERARHYLTGRAPSSPSIALLRNGELIYMLERKHIEIRSAEEIAQELTAAFEQFCAGTTAAK